MAKPNVRRAWLSVCLMFLLASVAQAATPCVLYDNRSTVPRLCPGGVFPTTCAAGVSQWGVDPVDSKWKVCHGGTTGGAFFAVEHTGNKGSLDGYAGLNNGKLTSSAVPPIHPHTTITGEPTPALCAQQGEQIDRIEITTGMVTESLGCACVGCNTTKKEDNVVTLNALTDTTNSVDGAAESFHCTAPDCQIDVDSADTMVKAEVSQPAPDRLLLTLDAAIPVSKSITLLSPTTGETNKIQLTWPGTVTLQRIACSTDTGTVSINFDERAVATPNTAGTNTLGSALVCDTDSQVTTSFSDTTVAADVPHNLQVTATSGSPTVVRIHVRGVMN